MTITLNAMKKLDLKKHGLLKKCKGDFDYHMKFLEALNLEFWPMN